MFNTRRFSSIDTGYDGVSASRVASAARTDVTMTGIKALTMVASAFAFYFVVLVLAWPMLMCLRWALSTAVKFRGLRRAATWSEALDLTITVVLLIGASAIATFFGGVAIDALEGNESLTVRAAATALALLIAATAFGVVHARNPTGPHWPSPLRVSPTIFEHCSEIGRLTIAFRMLWFSMAQATVFGLGLLVGLSILESYSATPDDGAGRRALAITAAYLVAMILAPGLTWLVLRWSSLQTTILITEPFSS
ncbi:hypothetical protein AB0M02_32155 [Actinoplanes sp. NPDC051861]|uniref:hypothetical protein n=1 Tax=Actinoplanes sp. NPDC051861 TaxID=3155170 RepID=UPI0034245007